LLANETAEICSHKIPHVLSMDQAYKHTLTYTSVTLNTNRKVTKTKIWRGENNSKDKEVKI